MSCGVGLRHGSDPALLWLWRRPEATAPIQPLAWEPPYDAGAALKRQKKKKKKNSKMELKLFSFLECHISSCACKKKKIPALISVMKVND